MRLLAQSNLWMADQPRIACKTCQGVSLSASFSRLCYVGGTTLLFATRRPTRCFLTTTKSTIAWTDEYAILCFNAAVKSMILIHHLWSLSRLDWPETPHMQSQFHQYRMYWTNCNRAGLCGSIQEPPFRTTKMAAEVIHQCSYHTTLPFRYLLLIPVWLSLCICHILCFSEWFWAYSSASVGTVPWKSKINLD